MRYSAIILFVTVVALPMCLPASPQPPAQTPAHPPVQPPAQTPAHPPVQPPAQTPAHPPVQPPVQPPSVACKSTPYPKLCRTILSSIKRSPSDPYNYGKFTIKQCLKHTKKLVKVIHRYAERVAAGNPPGTSQEEAGAVADCGELYDLNVDYLETISSKLKETNDMTEELVEDITSLLSGVVTNQQTCFDGLAEAKGGQFYAAIGTPVLGSLTRLYSVSLGLVTHALNKNLKRIKAARKKFFAHPNGARQPLETLIMILRSTCQKTKDCKKSDRRLTEEDPKEEDEGSSDGGGAILVSDAVIVGPYESDNFTTITAAIDAAPNGTKAEEGYFVIYAREGVYEEYVIVGKKKKNIMLIGDGINKTVITGNHSFIDGWTTYNSSSFAVAGEGFVAVDITFRNTAGPEKHQAVALRNNADLSTFYRCSFEGYQDTLYVHSLRQFYRDCDIYGTIDFIFGNAAAVFQNCNLYARKPMDRQKNAFTAQGRSDPNQNTGISIHNCTVKAAPDLAAEGPNMTTQTFLGRPWKLYSRTVIMESYIDDVVQPVGWLEWNGTVGIDTVYYGEFENYGPGANTSRRVQWPGYSLMNVTQARNFTVFNFTMGDTWIPYTDIPYQRGLVSKE